MDEDLAGFLADWGRPCVSAGVVFKAMLDAPDELSTLERGSVHSRGYELTYITSAVSLKRDQPVTVSGESYTVREAARQLGDGAFSRVLLTKV